MTGPAILWELTADLNDDGSYEADFSSRIKEIEYGFGREDALAAFSPRTLRATLGNQDKRFSPKYTAGPYGANLKRGRRCRLRASLGTTFPDTTNLVENPSAETNVNGWVAAGSSSRVQDTAKARYGRASVKVTVPNAANEGVNLYRIDNVTRFSVSAGTSYVFAPRVAVPSGKQMKIQIDWRTSIGSSLSTPSIDFDGSGTDTWLSPALIETAPTGAATAILQILTRSPGQGAFDFWADGGFFYAGADRRPYVDGDQPGATWAGTAHASQSTRLLAAQQNVAQFTGRMRSFSVTRRPELRGTMTLEASSGLETYLKKHISVGPFTRKKANLIAQRLVDLLEEGELILDGATREVRTNGDLHSAGETYTAIGATGGVLASQSSKTDPADYGAFEADYIRHQGNVAATEGWKIDVTSRVGVGVSHTVACFFATDQSLNNGKRLKLQLWGTVSGVIAETTVTLGLNAYVYATVAGVFGVSDTAREIRVVAQDTMENHPTADFFWDCLHMVPTANRIARTVSGMDFDIEFLASFHRSAAAILEEFADSACGWVYEDASNGLVFEEAQSSRAAGATPKTRVSDFLDGLTATLEGYTEPASNIYNKVRVGSYGDITALSSTVQTRRLWNLEPATRVLGANEEVTYFVDFMSEAEGQLIGRYVRAVALLSAGSLVANYPLCRAYGTSAEVVVKAGGSGATIKELWAEGRYQYRNQNERAYVEYNPSGSPLPATSVLELQAPGQGYKKSALTNLATWAGEKYVKGAPKVKAAIVDRGAGTDEAGIEAWQHAAEIVMRDVGVALWHTSKHGEGAIYTDGLFYVEGRRVRQSVDERGRREPVRCELVLEEA